MTPSSDEEDLAAIRRVLRAHPVRLALLYGSAATGTMHADSDYDVAVYFEGGPENPEYARRFTALRTALNGCVAREVDVVGLKTLGPRFAGRITETAEVIYDPENAAESLLDGLSIERPTKEDLEKETDELLDRLNANDAE